MNKVDNLFYLLSLDYNLSKVIWDKDDVVFSKISYLINIMYPNKVSFYEFIKKECFFDIEYHFNDTLNNLKIGIKKYIKNG